LILGLGRRWYLLVFALVIGVAAGLQAVQHRSNTFEAQAIVLVPADRSTYGSESVLERLLFNEMARVDSLDLKTAALADVGAIDRIDPRADMRVSQRPDSDVLDLRVTSNDPELAIVAANSWADTYATDARERKVHVPAELLAQTQTLINRLESELEIVSAELLEELAATPGASFNSIRGLLLARPDLDTRQQVVSTELRQLRSSAIRLRSEIGQLAPGDVIGRADGPLEPTRTGNGMGPVHGAIIALGLATALIVLLEHNALSTRSASAISSTVWPSRIKRHSPIARVGNQVLCKISGEGLPLIAFTSPGGRSGSNSREDLARHFADLGFDVAILNNGESESTFGHGVSVIPREWIGGVVGLATSGRGDLGRSLVLADLVDVWSRRSLVDASSVVAVVDLDRSVDTELAAAREIAKAHRLTANVFTVVG